MMIGVLSSLLLWCLLPWYFGGTLINYLLGLLIAVATGHWAWKTQGIKSPPKKIVRLLFAFLAVLLSSIFVCFLIPHFVNLPHNVDPTFLFLHSMGPLLIGTFLNRTTVLKWGKLTGITLALGLGALVVNHLFAVFERPGGILRLRPAEFTMGDEFQLHRRPLANLERSFSRWSKDISVSATYVLPVSLSLKFFSQKGCEGIRQKVGRSSDPDAYLPLLVEGYFDAGQRRCTQSLLSSYREITHDSYLALFQSLPYAGLPMPEKYDLAAKIGWMKLESVRAASLLNKGDVAVKQSALRSLASPKVLPVLPTILQLAENQQEVFTVRQAALITIGKLGDQGVEAVPTLLAMLKREDAGSPIADATILAVGWLGPVAKDAVPLLIRALSFAEPPTPRWSCGTGHYARRDPAPFALTRMGKEALPELRNARLHSNAVTRAKIDAVIRDIEAGKSATIGGPSRREFKNSEGACAF